MSSFASLNYHFVFSTKHREPLIDESWQSRLYDYMGGVLRQNGGLLLAAGGTVDHVHLLAAFGRSTTVADALREVKSGASKWVHETIPTQLGFAWQNGYGAFTVSHSNLDVVRQYLANQKSHHRGRTFQEEFLAFLARHEIAFDELYIWD